VAAGAGDLEPSSILLNARAVMIAKIATGEIEALMPTARAFPPMRPKATAAGSFLQDQIPPALRSFVPCARRPNQRQEAVITLKEQIDKWRKDHAGE
jgi:hypothetical protein